MSSTVTAGEWPQSIIERQELIGTILVNGRIEVNQTMILMKEEERDGNKRRCNGMKGRRKRNRRR